MATSYIVATGMAGTPDPGNVNGYPQIAAGTPISAQPGDVFIIDGAVNANITINAAGGGFTNLTGQTFVLATGNDGMVNGISLWTMNAAGQLTFQNARGDDRNGPTKTDPQGNALGRDLISPQASETGLNDAAAAAWAEIDGRTYVFIGGADDDVTIFRIDPDVSGDGTFDLTLVGQVDNSVPDISAMVFIPSGSGGTLVVGGEQTGLRFCAGHGQSQHGGGDAEPRHRRDGGRCG